MSLICPPQITNLHRVRRAIVYLRQSTLFQVEHNTGSTTAQYNQIEYARAWGWPEELIEFEDEDLGITGTSGEKRPGWTRLLRRIVLEEIGLILAADVSRLTRSATDFESLITLCRASNTLIAINGEILALDDPIKRLMARFRALLAQFDNEHRTQILFDAKLALARSGVAVCPPPTGYVSIRQPKDRVPTARQKEEN